MILIVPLRFRIEQFIVLHFNIYVVLIGKIAKVQDTTCTYTRAPHHTFTIN